MLYHHFDALGSTNDHLAALAEEGAPEWTVVVADRQTAGRGRGGRDWWSPPGNLHLSVLLRPKVRPVELMRVPIAASLAFLTALGKSGDSLTIKWPNDILLDGRKMAGILTESRSEGNEVQWAVVGFGVNMTRHANDIPNDISDSMAFVHELNVNFEPDEMAHRIVSGMKDWYGALKGEQWEKAREEWTRHALLKVPYCYKEDGKEVRGIPVRLDVSGGLVMDTQKGEVIVYSGEIAEIGES